MQHLSSSPRGLGLALACLGVAASPSSAGPPARVLLIGDSITEGQVSGTPGPAFAELLPDLLGPDHEVVNVACGGTTTLDWTISRGSTLCGGFVTPNLFEGLAVPELPAAVVTVMFGTNDAVGFFEPSPVSPRDYGRALAEIFRNLQLYGAGTVVLMTPPRRPCTAEGPVRDRLIAYREIVLAACGEVEGAACGPDVFTLLDGDDFAGCDVHPNLQGHALIAETLAAVILGLP